MTTFNTGNAVPSTNVKDLYDNTQTEDERVNSDAFTTITRTGKVLKTFAGMDNDFYNVLANTGFETTHLVYTDGQQLKVDRPNQLIDRAGTSYSIKFPSAFPVTLTGNWATDQTKLVERTDGSLRQQLSAGNGGALVGFQRPEAGSVATSFYTMALEKYSARAHFGAVGDNTADDTVKLQAAIDAIALKQGFQTTLPSGVTGAYVSNTAALDLGNGVFKISKALKVPAYVRLIGQGAVVRQTVATEDVVSNLTDAYQQEYIGINFTGGRYSVNLQNNNLDTTRYFFRGCTFSLSAGFALKFFPTGGAGSHLSCEAVIDGCGFFKPRQVLQSFCDSLTVRNSWVFVSKDNFDASRCAFELGSSTTDGYPNLYFDGMFGVPDMGTGTDRLANIRWFDHWKGGIFARNSRFGGESGGMPIVYYLGKPVTTYPFRGDCISLSDSEVFAGPAAANDSSVLAAANGQFPQRFSMVNCTGPVNTPYIINPVGVDIDNYMAAFETASGQKAWNYFKYLIENNDSVAPDGTVYQARVPLALRKYVNNFRATKIKRNAAQALSVNPSPNYVNFDVVGYDTQGGFNSANPSYIYIPQAATKLRVTINLKTNGNSSNGGLWNVKLEDSQGNIQFADDKTLAANTDGHEWSFSGIVEGNPLAFFRLNILTTASAPGSIVRCSVTTEALDYIN